MYAEVLSISAKFLMNNHIYEFNNNLYLQDGTGSIGLQFTGVAKGNLHAEMVLRIQRKTFQVKNCK